MLPRVHLFEWNDQSWLPERLRNAETEYLATVIDLARPFALLASKLARLVEAHGDRIVDLASGGAGPWRKLRDEIGRVGAGLSPEVTLTDLHPNLRAFRRTGLRYETGSVDARAVPARLSGIRTMFDAFHHLRSDDARAVLADAHRAGAPIVVADATNRRLSLVLLSIVFVPLVVLLVTPLVRPWSGWRLILTYLVPILPLLIVWDGVVSCLRTYRPDELLAFTEGLDNFRWEAAEMRTRGAIVTYLIGEPVHRTSSTT
jgi:hypothetical protein